VSLAAAAKGALPLILLSLPLSSSLSSSSYDDDNGAIIIIQMDPIFHGDHVVYKSIGMAVVAHDFDELAVEAG